MKAKDLIKNRQNIKEFLSQILVQVSIDKSDRIGVSFSLFRHLSNKKSEIRSIVDQLRQEDLIKIDGVLSIDEKEVLPAIFFDTELATDLPASTIKTVIVSVNRNKIEGLITPKPDKENPSIFTLEKDGRITRVIDGIEEKCQFDRNDGPYHILKTLAQNKPTPLSSSEIMDEIRHIIKKRKKAENKRYVRDAVEKIKTRIAKNFTGIGKNDFIMRADEYGGYILNKHIKIKLPNY